MKPVHVASIAGAAAALALENKILDGITYKMLKKTGENAKYTTGIPGDVYHITTNKKLSSQEKDEVVKEIKKDGYKQIGEVVFDSGVVGTGVGLVTLCSKNAKKFFAGVKNNIADFAGKIKYDDKTLRETIAQSGIYKKFKALPAPVKVGATVAASLIGFCSMALPKTISANAAYIEAKHEQ